MVEGAAEAAAHAQVVLMVLCSHVEFLACSYTCSKLITHCSFELSVYSSFSTARRRSVTGAVRRLCNWTQLMRTSEVAFWSVGTQWDETSLVYPASTAAYGLGACLPTLVL